MRFRFGPWTLALALIAVCGLLVGGIWWYRSAAPQPIAAMLSRIPPGVQAIAGIDVHALRKSGVLNRLAGPQELEQAEYRSFVDMTGFNYRADLDYALVGVGSAANYFLLRGRFDWSAVLKYAELNGGVCTFGFCRITGDSGREISYFPQRSDVLAIAVGRDAWGAGQMAESRRSARQLIPTDAPLWIVALKPMLDNPDAAPASVRRLLAPLKGSEQALLTVNALGEGFEFRLTVDCTSGANAAVLEANLGEFFRQLRAAGAEAAKLSQPEDVAGSANLAMALADGKVSMKGHQVEAVWAVGNDFLDAIAGGSF